MEFNAVQKVTVWALPVIFAITGHEVAHGWVASRFGDQTARLAGRLTLNPIKHIDLLGTIIVPLVLLFFSNFIFGWAKPVPVDARNMRYPRYQMVVVSLAGPLANLLMALLWAGVAKLAMNLNGWAGVPLLYMGQAGIMINVVLGVLNCLPILPLDGGRALSYFLPGRMGWNYARLEPYGFFILLILMFTGVLWYVLNPPISFLVYAIYAGFGLY